jgi:hypothetical protein
MPGANGMNPVISRAAHPLFLILFNEKTFI